MKKLRVVFPYFYQHCPSLCISSKQNMIEISSTISELDGVIEQTFEIYCKPIVP